MVKSTTLSGIYLNLPSQAEKSFGIGFHQTHLAVKGSSVNANVNISSIGIHKSMDRKVSSVKILNIVECPSVVESEYLNICILNIITQLF